MLFSLSHNTSVLTVQQRKKLMQMFGDVKQLLLDRAHKVSMDRVENTFSKEIKDTMLTVCLMCNSLY